MMDEVLIELLKNTPQAIGLLLLVWFLWRVFLLVWDAWHESREELRDCYQREAVQEATQAAKKQRSLEDK